MPRAPVISIAHGGGPMPLLNHHTHTQLTHSLKTKVPLLLHLGTPQAPRGIIVVTAHWEAETPTISSSLKHSLYYDYYGFPPETYDLHYDAPGSPEIAKEVFDALEKAGLRPKLDIARGWDHGVFVPMLLVNPSADIPIIQMSVLSARAESPSTLFAMGAALEKLRDSNIAIVGSGLSSMHNLSLLAQRSQSVGAKLDAFNRALSAAVMIKDVGQRKAALEKWRTFEGADLAHRPDAAEHLFPLMVCAGAAGEKEGKMWVDIAMRKNMVSYYWD